MADAATPPNDEDEGPQVDLGEHRWNLKRGTFHSEHLGVGRIVSLVDDDAEIYEFDELDDDVQPVAAVVELLEGEHAGSFVNIDISSPDYSIAASAYN